MERVLSPILRKVLDSKIFEKRIGFVFFEKLFKHTVCNPFKL